MKAVVVHSFTDVRVEEREVPLIGPDEILVQTQVSGICSGDVMPWYINKKAPLVLGHEPSGIVVKTGQAVTDFRVGDRVFVHHHAPCFTCHDCKRGNYSMCQTWKNSRIDPGGMAEYFRVPAQNLTDTLILPPEVDFTAGALVEPVACAVKAIRRAQIEPGDKVLVIGLGVMGQILAKLAKLQGAGEVIGSDFVEVRRQKALELGADKVIDPTTQDLSEEVQGQSGRLADVVIVGPPSITALQQGIACTGKGGTVLMFTPAPPGDCLTVVPHDLYFKEISLIPSYSCGPNDTRTALELFRQGKLCAGDFISHRFSLAQAPQAFLAMAGGKDVVKAAVYFPTPGMEQDI